ncbi:MAG: zinc-dependent alcohol dehydrogenase family protein [Candidatus Hodarchaeota archaeon]
MKAARFIGEKTIEIKEEPTPNLNPKDILVKVQASGICGTDLHIYEGKVRGLVKPGTVLGHEFSGTVEAIGAEVTSHQVGDRVAIEPNLFCGVCHFCRNAKKHFCENWTAIGLSQDGGFAEYCAVPASAAYILPKDLDFRTAAFFEPMGCVLHGIERGRVVAGETVVVQGVGAIGQLFVQVLNNLGVANIIVSDIGEKKLLLAKKFGANRIVNAKTENLVKIVKEETNGYGAHVMIDAAGLLNTIPTAFEILENTGRLVVFGVPPEGKTIEIRPFDIYRREIDIVGSFTNPYTNEAALEMLRKVNVDSLITNAIKLDDLIEKGLKMVGKLEVLKVQIQF